MKGKNLILRIFRLLSILAVASNREMPPWLMRCGFFATMRQGDAQFRSQVAGAVPGLGVGQLSRFRFYPRPSVREPHTEITQSPFGVTRSWHPAERGSVVTVERQK
jgi:hypothetical protein